VAVLECCADTDARTVPAGPVRIAVGMAMSGNQPLWTVDVKREDSEPVRCECCRRRNYSMGRNDERSEILRVGTGLLHSLCLCREHADDLRRPLEVALRRAESHEQSAPPTR
jgi:hypothetical protein